MERKRGGGKKKKKRREAESSPGGRRVATIDLACFTHREFPTGREILPLVECRVTINIDDAPFSPSFFLMAVSRPFRYPSSTAIVEFILAVRGGGRRRKGRATKRERDG